MSASIRRSRRRAPLLAGAAIAATVATVVAAPQAQAQLSDVSTRLTPAAVDPVHGFPLWYSDRAGVKLQLCVVDDLCLGGNSLPDPDAPASLDPDTLNFPDEAFYAVARGETELNKGGRIRWRAVLEGAFANGDVVNGDQMTFTRVQVTGDKINTASNAYPVGTEITFETPYGDLKGTVQAKGKLVRDRKETDPGDASNNFTGPLTETLTTFGPTFVQWDDSLPARPDGYIGNPAVLHKIKGGDRTYFQAVLKTPTTRTEISPRVTRFEVAGKKAP